MTKTPNNKKYMTIFAGDGDIVCFHGNGGYDGQREEAKKLFQEWQHLVIEYVDVYSSSSYVKFKDFPGTFNTCLFANVKINKTKAYSRARAYYGRHSTEDRERLKQDIILNTITEEN